MDKLIRYRKRWPVGTRIKKKCLICGKTMVLIMSQKDRKKTCCRECYYKLLSKRLAKFNPRKKGTKLIKTAQGVAYIRFNNSSKIGKIDADDYEKIKKYSWRVHKNHDNRGVGAKSILYAFARRFRGESPQAVLMHRFILGIEGENANISKRQVDHINHNGLDNRKSNLRIVTQSQNNQNVRKGVRGKYPNVQWNSITGKFSTFIKTETRKIMLGDKFNTPDEALKVYEKARKEFIKTGKVNNIL